MAECAQASHTESDPQAHSGTLRARPKHREIAQFSGFCIAAVRRVRQQFRERGRLEPRTHLCGRTTLLTEERKQRLHQLLSGQPDATLAELGAGLDCPFRTSTIDL